MRNKLIAKTAACFLLTVLFMQNAACQAPDGVTLAFKFNKGDSYRILSTIEEDVFINNTFNHHSIITNRVAVRVRGVDVEGNGLHEAAFMASDEAQNGGGAFFSWNEEYKSEYIKSPRGEMKIDKMYFMPVLRNMPVFPARPLKKNDVWQHEGYEAHDLRRTFGLSEPFQMPFNAVYTYLGEQEDDGRVFDVIEAVYSIFYRSPDTDGKVPRGDLPASTTGYSNHTIYWDREKGAIDHYDETFRIVINMLYGDVYKFTGTTRTEITEFKQSATEENVQKLQEAVDSLKLKDVAIDSGEKGLTISLENIQFAPDSEELSDTEKVKLEKIAGLLKAFPENDLLISGHTALAGTAQSRQELSKKRADAVAGYLIEIGAKKAGHVFTRGMGATEPLSDNSTEEGMARNRRVEITILDK